MKVTFWGVRGSMPTPELNKMKVGGNTTCVELRLDNGTILIFDAGTGLISCGKSLLEEFQGKPLPKVHLFLTHLHWDHIYGFPFFPLNFIPGLEINVYGPVQPNQSLEKLMLSSMDYHYCPIKFSQLPSVINFIEISEGRYEFFPDTILEMVSHLHPGGAYSYRIEADGKTFVFNTDVEHYPTYLDPRVIEISRDADLMVHDGQYRQDEIENYVGWGHSSPEQAVQVAKEAGVKKLGITHHDPERCDKKVREMEKDLKKIFKSSFFCKEGMEIEL